MLEHFSPNQAGVADEFEHHVLGEDAPPLTPPAVEHLVEDRDRQHDDDDAGGETGQQGVSSPERSSQGVRNDATR